LSRVDPADSRLAAGRSDARRGRPFAVAEAGDLAFDVERANRAAMLVLAPRVTRNAPHDLEFVAVRISAVERFRDAVVARSPERAGRGEHIPSGREVGDRRDFPGEVVQPDRATRRVLRLRPDREQPEVVVVTLERAAQEDRLPVHLATDDLEPEDPRVELGSPLGIANEQDGVVEAGDGNAHRTLSTGSVAAVSVWRRDGLGTDDDPGILARAARHVALDVQPGHALEGPG